MEVRSNYKIIESHYNDLISITKKHLFVGMVNEWFVDNYYLLAEKKSSIMKFLKNKKLSKHATKNIDLYEVVSSILVKLNYKIDKNILIEEINNYQKKTKYNLTYEEISILPFVVFILLINKLSEICENESLKLSLKKDISNRIEAMRIDASNDKHVSLLDYFDLKNVDERYIAYLNENLRDLGSISEDMFKELNTYLKDNNLKLRDVIETKHLKDTADNILINYIFDSFRRLNETETENLYNNISSVENILKKDKYYNEMTVETKGLYRERVILLAQKNRITQEEYIKKVFNKDIHIGFALFSHQDKRSLFLIYLVFISTISIILSLLLGKYLCPVAFIGFIILLIPISEVVIWLTNKFLMKKYPSKPIPKMDFIKGIPKDYPTMVVIPTIVKDEQKVVKLFAQLESYYLANKSENLYFTILGDCKEYEKEIYPEDQNIIKSGLRECELLNKKYKKELFNFVYRKRLYNPKEGKWMGFERKRGGLIHFNRLLLGLMTPEEEKKYFNIQTLDNFKKKIKYVITLDCDTNLILNAALKLVGIMAHPLNAPVIKNNRVVSGYGIIQPHIDIDINASNKSLFTQIYGGMGGFDPYNNIYPNFYQDVFGEGSFIGKGIYDLAVFEQVLDHTFPNDLILSHDLLEGNYIRCGYASDIELIDDFPSKFLIDASRRSRWARGDFQIIGWTMPYVRNEERKLIKNPLSALHKWKIFDNIRRSLLDLNLLLIICISILSASFAWLWLAFVLFIVILPIISYIFDQISTVIKKTTMSKRYNIIVFSNKTFWLRTLSAVANIPFNAYLYCESMLKSLYRMTISKKNLLNWLTAEDAEKLVDTSLKNHFKRFGINIFVAILLVVLSIILKNAIFPSLIIGIVFILSPIINYSISTDLNQNEEELEKDDQAYLKDLAKKTWNYFYTFLTSDNNYLIPDNYQLNRAIKQDIKTSPTNIGFSVVSIISAFELKFIDKEETFKLIEKVLKTIEILPKWNGHLYNWYNIKTLKVMAPNFVSSVDSGNFVACLIVAKEFCSKQGEYELMNRFDTLIKKSNFALLYTDSDVFSVGYNVNEGKLVPYNYDKYISESRITSFLAIAKGDVPNRHWFKLEKMLTSYNNKKGLVSWGGTSFEYFTPLIFIRSYPNTIAEESYSFAYYAQKEFMKEVNPDYPWGISESAYNELDDAQNYKYKTFATSYLKLREEPSSRIVISPYSSLLALPKFKNEVVENVKKFSKLGMEGQFGLYESYDVTDEKPVYTFFAHHQGMILASITNCLCNNVIQNYFSNEKNNRAFDILNQEKIQIKSVIDIAITKYKKYTYEKESYVNDIRIFYNISTMPQLSVLSNSKYTTLINDRGNGFSRYRTIQLNRYRKITKQDYGLYVYVKNISNNKIWSNTYAPINVMPKKYEVVFALDRIKFIREDDDIITTTEIVVSRVHHAEIRKITFRNTSNETKTLELTTYTEPIICENPADISHQAFNNLFVESEYDNDTNSLIMKRKLRNSTTDYYYVNRLFIQNPSSNYQYETSRDEFIGRNNDTSNPAGLYKKLSNYAGTQIDPIVSLRNTIIINKNSEKTVFLIAGFGKSKEQVLDIVNTYNDPIVIEEQAFKVANIMSNVTTKMSNINGNDMRVYNTLLNHIYQTYHFINSEKRNNLLENNTLSQRDLWKFGISGDRPIIFVNVKNLDDLSLIKELLHAFEYFKSKSIFVDLVILNCKNTNDAKALAKEIENEKYRMDALNSFYKIPGNIFLLEAQAVTEEEVTLFNTIARLVIETNLYNSLQEYVYEVEKENSISRKSPITIQKSLLLPYDKNKIKFFNEYGGFISDGKEYLIVNRNTPLAWSNVLANPNFGSIVTSDTSGFTYAKNAQSFKITSWTNDSLLDICSEGIEIDDAIIKFEQIKIGYGYTEFYAKIEGLTATLTEFVSLNDPVKFYNLRITNETNSNKDYKVSYWINPVLGETAKKTSRHLLGKQYEDKNYVTIQNKYSINYSNQIVFMGSTEKLSSSSLQHTITKKITSNIKIKNGETKDINFLLGSSDSNVEKYVNRYTSEKITEQLKLVKKDWKEKLSIIEASTPDESFNYLINGWLLYQTISSRLYAKSGFQQVGGAYGFRDQLQDAMNICISHPEITKEQILKNASHQFEQGDVLHWWHENISLGLRSRYKDDYLWLVYAVSEYIKITGDKDILNIQVPFASGEQLKAEEQELVINYSITDKTASLYDHCILTIDKAMSELGENGIPLMGGGDWNDGMNRVGYQGKGTSVWLGFFLYYIIDMWSEIEMNDANLRKYKVFNEKLKTNLGKTWDGNYYTRAYFDNNHPLGSSKNKECSIDIISQSFSILTGIASSEQKEKIYKAINKNLIDKNNKLIKLLNPPFVNSEDDPGYIMDYPSGIRENGGQYTHAVAWYILALLRDNKIDDAYEYYQMINPINHSSTKESVDKYKAEPYVICADVCSNPRFAGQGGWTWYTGSSGWFYKVAMVDILGFNKQNDILRITPKVPSKWNSYKLTYQFEDTTYIINVVRDEKKSGTYWVDKTKAKYIKLINDKKTHEVEAFYGGNDDKI